MMRRHIIQGLSLALLVGLSAVGLILLRTETSAAAESDLAPSYTEESYALKPAPFTPVIDAGHGGEDGGAVSPGGRSESAYNLDIALKTDVFLRFLGLSPRMTRTEDVSLHDDSAETLREKKVSDLKNRVRLVHETEGAVLLSIHQNKFTSAKYSGTQVFSRNDDTSRALAQSIQQAVRQWLQPDNTRENKTLEVMLLDDTSCPAVLVECGFLSHTQEEALLRDGAYQLKLSMVLSVALTEWVMNSEN